MGRCTVRPQHTTATVTITLAHVGIHTHAFEQTGRRSIKPSHITATMETTLKHVGIHKHAYDKWAGTLLRLSTRQPQLQ